MDLDLSGRLRRRQRRRRLASNDRVARYGRDQIWSANIAFLRKTWWAVLLSELALAASVTPLALVEHGAARGAVLGFAAASGFWLPVIGAVVFTGTGARITGTIAETWTAEDLRSLSSRGWSLVNGLELRRGSDIDHIAVGPPGLLVVESKWIGDVGGSSTADRFRSAATKVATDRVAVERHFKRDLQGVPVTGCVAVWGPAARRLNGHPTEDGGITLVPGPELRDWLAGLPPVPALDLAEQQRLWRAVGDHAGKVDAYQRKKFGPQRPTVRRLAWRWLVQPFLGVIGAFYTMAFPPILHRWFILLPALAVGTAAGTIASRVEAVRPAALAWAATCAALLVAWCALAAAYSLG